MAWVIAERLAGISTGCQAARRISASVDSTGLEPFDWKPMPSIGPGVREIWIHTSVEHRVCYVAKFAEAIYVLHVFEKRTRKTAQHDVDLARRRYRDLVAHREQRVH